MVKKNYDSMLSRFHPIPERHGQTDGRTDGPTNRIAISISRSRTIKIGRLSTDIWLHRMLSTVRPPSVIHSCAGLWQVGDTRRWLQAALFVAHGKRTTKCL